MTEDKYWKATIHSKGYSCMGLTSKEEHIRDIIVKLLEMTNNNKLEIVMRKKKSDEYKKQKRF